MRWAIGFLVVINLTIFLWGSLTRSPAVPDRHWRSASAVSDVDVLPPQPFNAQLTEVVSPVVPSAEDSSPAGDELPELLSLPAPAAGRGPEPAEIDPSVATVDPEAGSLDEGGDSKPTLTGTEVASSGESDSTSATDAAESTPVAETRLYCGQVGPLSEVAEAESVKARLAEAGLQPVLQEVVVPSQKGYWVLIPPASDRDEGQRTLARLKEKGIEDTWLFSRGELSNAISLGLYNRRGNADQRREQLESLGFQVEVRPRIEAVSHYQVSFSGELPVIFDQVRRLTPGLESRDSACTRASADQNEL